MKRILLFMTGALLVTTGINAQITLSQSSYTSSPIGTDSLKVTTAASSFPSFTTGTNVTWDLSTVTDSSANILAYKVSAVSPATFADSNFYSLGTNAYQGNVQSAIVSGGLLEYGIVIDSVTYPLTSPDTIFFRAQHSAFSSTHTVIKFPASMTNSWSSTYESDFNYEVTYSPGYVHAPGIAKSYITEKDSVIGWGQMRIKTAAGTPSGYMSVLQVRSMITTVDSFYLNGGITDPAIPTLLNLLNATQGQVTKTYAQNFYRVNEVTPLAYVQFSDSANTTPTKATTHVQRLALPAGVPYVFNEANVKIYPNPVGAGSDIYIDMPATSGFWKYEIVNVNGQVLSSYNLDLNTSVSHSNYNLRTPAIPGTYFIRIVNDGKQVYIKPLVVN